MIADETLFKWDPNRSKLLREFWEDYALVMETLEENQVEHCLYHDQCSRGSVALSYCFGLFSSAGSCSPTSSKQNRLTDPNNSE